MKRDFDLIRKILFYAEEHGHKFISKHSRDNLVEVVIDGYSKEEVIFHLEILYSGGLVESGYNYVHNSRATERIERDKINYLTWAGFEYLDKVRDPTRWESIKKRLQPLGDFSYEAVNRTVAQLATEQVKLYAPLAFYTAFAYLAGFFSKFFR